MAVKSSRSAAPMFPHSTWPRCSATPKGLLAPGPHETTPAMEALLGGESDIIHAQSHRARQGWRSHRNPDLHGQALAASPRASGERRSSQDQRGIRLDRGSGCFELSERLTKLEEQIAAKEATCEPPPGRLKRLEDHLTPRGRGVKDRRANRLSLRSRTRTRTRQKYGTIA
jgi:hypothetical protein